MRKKAQEMRKRNLISSSSSSSSLCNINSSSSTSATTEASMDSFPYDLHYVKSDQNIGKNNKGDGGASSAAHLVSGPGECEHKEEDAFKAYPMEQIWKEIASTEMVSEALLDENFRFDGGTFPGTPMDIPSPIWDYQIQEIKHGLLYKGDPTPCHQKGTRNHLLNEHGSMKWADQGPKERNWCHMGRSKRRGHGQN